MRPQKRKQNVAFGSSARLSVLDCSQLWRITSSSFSSSASIKPRLGGFVFCIFCIQTHFYLHGAINMQGWFRGQGRLGGIRAWFSPRWGEFEEGGGLHQQALIYVGEQMAEKLLCLEKMCNLFQLILERIDCCSDPRAKMRLNQCCQNELNCICTASTCRLYTDRKTPWSVCGVDPGNFSMLTY